MGTRLRLARTKRQRAKGLCLKFRGHVGALAATAFIGPDLAMPFSLSLSSRCHFVHGGGVKCRHVAGRPGLFSFMANFINIKVYCVESN